MNEPEYDAFLSHNSKDKPAVRKIAEWLRKRGLRCFLDEESLIGGDAWVEGLDKGLASSKACVVFIGGSGLGNWQTEETHAALDQRARNHTFRVVPVLLADSGDPRKNRMPTFLRTLSWVDLRGGAQDESALARLERAIRSATSTPSATPGAPNLRWLHLADLDLPRRRNEWEGLVSAFRQGPLRDRRPDLVFLTGDIATTAAESEYAEAAEFVRNLAEVTGIPLGRFFVVPGDRDREARRAQRFKLELLDAEAVSEFLSDREEVKTALRPFERFVTFQCSTLGRKLTPERPYVTEHLKLFDVGIRIVGFNTAWVQGEADASLVLGEPLAQRAMHTADQRPRPDLTIVLAHHPVSALAPFEREIIGTLLERTTDVVCTALGDTEDLTGTIHITAGTETSGAPVARLVEVQNDHLTITDLRPSGGWKPSSDVKRHALARPLTTATPPVAIPGAAAAPPDVERYLTYIENDRGSLAVTGLVHSQKADSVPVRQVYCPLRTLHPALARADKRPNDDAPSLRHGPSRRARGRREATSELVKKALSSDGQAARAATEELLRAVGFTADIATDKTEQAAARRRLRPFDDHERSAELKQALKCISLEEAFARVPLLLVEGDPGSGKTTTLQHIAISLVEAHRGDTTWADRMGFEAPYPFPVFLPFREFWEWLCEQPKHRLRRPDRSLLLEFLRGLVSEASGGEEWIDAALAQGRVCVLLDGLDEIPEDGHRAKAASAVRAVVQAYGKRCRFALTSRPAGLGPEERRALIGDAELTKVVVEPLRRDQIRTFVRAWCEAIHKSYAKKLIAAVQNHELAKHPIMLVAMILVYHIDGELPAYRAKLYERCSEALAGRWDLRMHDDAGRALAGPVSIEHKLKVLETLAETIYTRGSAQELRLEPRETSNLVTAALPKRHRPPSERAALDFVQRLADRSGLLIPEAHERGWRFRHKTFLEYLTARKICRNAADPGDKLGPHLTRTWWREVIILAAGHEAMGGSGPAKRLLRKLWHSASNLDDDTARASGLGVVALAALDVHGIGVDDWASSFPPDWKDRLVNILEDPVMPGSLDARVALARLLGLAGDPRTGHEPQEHMVRVPEGPFLMGGTDDEAYDDEKPVHEVWLSTFRIARHPVTCAQFAAFIDDGGYQDVSYWSHGGGERKGLQAFRATLTDTPNHPVTEVNWFEAVAYCAWLTKKCPLENGWVYRLPTEAEWEKAARGGLQVEGTPNPDMRRAYPWGDEFIPEAANSSMSQASLVPIGCHAGGQGPYGTHDQAGNVWEWTLDAWSENYEVEANHPQSPKKDPVRYERAKAIAEDALRVVRGGSFGNNPRGLRVSFRSWDEVRRRVIIRGFRVVASVCPSNLHT